jgi:co-chaperonin GroES (HSP10)
MSETGKVNSVFTLDDALLSFVFAYKPYKSDEGKESYTAHGIIIPDHPQLAALQKVIRDVAFAKWKEESETILKQLKAQDRLFIHRGNIAKAGRAEYKDKLFISTSRKAEDGPPTVVATVDGVNQKTDARHALAVYSGCKGRVMFNVWAQDNKAGGKRINAGLMGLQFLAHGPRLSGSGRVASADEFGIVATDADAPAPSTATSGDDEGLV